MIYHAQGSGLAKCYLFYVSMCCLLCICKFSICVDLVFICLLAMCCVFYMFRIYLLYVFICVYMFLVYYQCYQFFL